MKPSCTIWINNWNNESIWQSWCVQPLCSTTTSSLMNTCSSSWAFTMSRFSSGLFCASHFELGSQLGSRNCLVVKRLKNLFPFRQSKNKVPTTRLQHLGIPTVSKHCIVNIPNTRSFRELESFPFCTKTMTG